MVVVSKIPSSTSMRAVCTTLFYHTHNQIESDDQRLCVCGHAYSVNGLWWTFTGTSWSNRVVYLNGSMYAFSRRERFHFGFLHRGKTIAAFTTSIQYGKGAPVSLDGEDASYPLPRKVTFRSRK